MITRQLKVPTGDICVMQGEHGLLEFVSIGDYGKNSNIKADFLGISRELNGVPNGVIMPLQKKWVITISTQYGCSMGCKFCDVPKVGKGINATLKDLTCQIIDGLSLHPDVKHTQRLNIHYARMGEPTFNLDVIEHAYKIKDIIKPNLGNSLVHPVVSTMMPKNNKLLIDFLNGWCNLKNKKYHGNAGLQLSINSTENTQRKEMFNNNSMNIEEISEIAKTLPDPIGRKYTLNFALADNYIVDAKKLSKLFDIKKFMAKITPLHKTNSCDENGIVTTNGYDLYTPYKKTEEDLKKAGFDVIVFIPSYDEDNGMITCGNAILSGKNPSVKYEEVKNERLD
jgi:23S rRNA (adenine2503-C2)-methyltransferase